MYRLAGLILWCCPLLLQAQFTYVLDQTIPVKDSEDNILSLAWAGGLNAAQYNKMDLNDDNQPDLVLFDRMANKVLTYINQNNQYEYAPEYEELFPDEVTNWILLRDFNCDGKKDLFTGDVLGIKVYTNTSQPGQPLSWQPFTFFTQEGQPRSPVLLTKGFSGKINLQLQYDDLPSITDVDGDGDLDILNVRFVGAGTVEFHQNFSMERYGTCDSLDFERITQSWGGITECQCGVFAFNGQPCPSPGGGRTEHAGGKALLAFDIDNDQDLDLLISEAECTRIYFLRNEGSPQNPIFTSATSFPASDPVNFLIFPAAFFEDIDFDGTKDLIATPNIFSKEFFNTNLRESNWFYKNTGTNALPNFEFEKTNYLQDLMIDVGDNAVPAFADIDGDGDWDMFVGQNTGENFSASLHAYRNNGTNETPDFKLMTNDYLGISFLLYYNLKPQFADIDGNNTIDLIFTATGLQNPVTRIYYVPNLSTTGLQFSGENPIQLNFPLTFSENVHVTDVNDDGLADLLVGRNNGALEYWRNTGSEGSLDFVLEDGEFLGFGSSVLRQSPAFSSADLNADGKIDLVMGDQYGVVHIISNYKEDSPESSTFTEIIFNPLLNRYTTKNLGGRLWPTVVNLFSTDKPAIVLGNIMGGVQVLRNDDGRSLPNRPNVNIFPNPAERSQILNIKIDRFAYVQILSSLGKELSSPVWIQPNQIYSYNIGSLPAGVYIARFYVNEKTYSQRFVIY
jgi:hypothetical protein